MVWMKSGMAIHRIVSGLLIMTSPLNENNSTRVMSSATIVTGVSRCKNFSLNHVSPFAEMIHLRER